MKTNDFEFETIVIDTDHTRYHNMVWLTSQSRKVPNVLNISNDIANKMGFEPGKLYRFDLQVAKNGTCFALYFNKVGLCNLKNRQCINSALCGAIRAKLVFYDNYESITKFDAKADVENSRIIFTPIFPEDK